MNRIFIKATDIDPVTEILGGEFDKTKASTSIDGQRVDGYLLTLTNDLLWKLDQFFSVPANMRYKIIAETDSETSKAFCYLPNPAANNISSGHDIKTFNHFADNNNMGLYDIHLLFPCSLDNFDESYIKPVTCELCDQFLDAAHDRSSLEFKGDFVKKLKRCFLGYFTIFTDLRGVKYPQVCMATLSKHKETNVGVLNLSIISGAFPGHHILTDFCARALCIEDTSQTVYDWLSKMGITVYGTPRSVVFAYNELSDESILNALVAEAIPSGAIVGDGFTKKLNENLAQYDTAKVYASEVCLIEIIPLADYCLDTITRISDQTVELFFIELLLLQDAAISRISSKILDNLNKETKKKAKLKDNLLDELVCESAQAILFFDLNEFLFPTVRLSAENVAKCFGIDRQMATYEKYKNILDQLITLRNDRQAEIKNSSLNSVLFVLTLAQVFPLFLSGYKYLFNSQISSSDIIPAIYGVLSCVSMWVIYRLTIMLRSHQKKKQKNKTISGDANHWKN